MKHRREMKKLIAIAIIFFILGFCVKVFALPGDLSTQRIFNRVLNTTTNTIRITGV